MTAQLPLMPLSRFHFIHTQEPEMARDVLARSLGPIEVTSISPRRALDWWVNRIVLGPMTLYSGRLCGGWSFHGELNCHLLITPVIGHARIVQPDGDTDLSVGEVGAILSPHTRVAWRVESDVANVSTRIEPGFLEAQLEALTGVTPRGPLYFTTRLPIDVGRGASLTRLLHFIIGELERGTTALEHPVVITSLLEAAVRGLLFGQRHSGSHLLERPAPRAAPAWVRKIEEYLEAHAAEPVRMADLAKLSGTSVRAIQAAFRAHRGHSPMAFLRMKRMELARRALLAPTPATSVTSVAYASGFLQPGQFSVDYRRRYGESPSETLRRGRAAR